MKDFSAWMPSRLRRQPAGWRVEWRRLGQLRFTEPFFAQTLNDCVEYPANLLFARETGMETLGELAATTPGLPPTVFIFHLSRCGSTLITQTLAASERNIVISEAGPVNDVLQAHRVDPGVTDALRQQWLQWLVNVLGRRRFPAESHLFIKFDCWHSLALPLIRRAFPQVPWLFVYRDPVEILASHRQLRGPQMIPGVLNPAIFGWDEALVRQMGLEEYGARVLAAVAEAALTAAGDGTGEWINYRELPDKLLHQLVPRWNPGLTEPEREQAAAASRRNAKNPVLPFEDDTRAKQAVANEPLRELSRRWLEPVYARLEAARQAGQGAPASRSS